MRSITFMILGDAHLDSDFDGDMAERRREERVAFEEAIGIVKKYGFDYLFVSGDLFDKRIPGAETLNYVKNAFRELKYTNIVIAPGNHDPYTIDSPYYNTQWPENVYIFNSRKLGIFEFNEHSQLLGGTKTGKVYTEGHEEEGTNRLRIYGSCFDGHFIRKTMLTDDAGRTPRLSAGIVNVLLMHGTFSKDKTTNNPIDEEVLAGCGFDACIIGGTHRHKKYGTILSSGVLSPRNFDECGRTGVVVGEITPEGKVLSEFMPVNRIIYKTGELDVTNLDDLSEKALADKIREIFTDVTCIRVTLTGSTGYGEEIDTVGLKEALLANYSIVEIFDKTVKCVNLGILSGENSPRGLFVKNLISYANEKEDEISTTQADRAILTALKTFGQAGGNV